MKNRHTNADVIEVDEFDAHGASSTSRSLQLEFFEFNNAERLKQILHEINGRLMKVKFTAGQDQIAARFYHNMTETGVIQRTPLSALLKVS